ncbi:MAG: isochorismatase family protein [Eubacteriales bacterium]|nr:isochorismatase family protein [Eubacteriales bacterium]
MRMIPEETQCMVIDMQEKLLPAMYNRRDCEDRVLMLVRGLRALEIPLLVTQQYTKGLGNSVPQVYEAAGSEEFFDKRTFSCAQDENIVAALKDRNRKNVIICGTEAHVCVLQTCIDLKAMGYQPILVTDAIASRKKNDLKMAIQRAIQEDILVTTAEALLFELTVDSRNPHFREISTLVK